MKVGHFHAALFIAIVSSAEGARILAVIAFPGKSHMIIIQPILEALADAGHEVVVYTPIPKGQTHPNYREVVLEDIKPVQKSDDRPIEQMLNLPPWKFVDNLLLLSKNVLTKFLQHKKVIDLIHSKKSFDLVITESFFAQEFTLLFGHIFNAPTIVIHTFVTTSHINMNMGNVLSLGSVPDCCSSSTNKMTLGERMSNALCVLRGLYLYYNEHLPTVERMMGEYVPGLPPLREMMNNVSLVFTNDHLTADYSQPRIPNMIPVGGIHIKREKPLPRDLKEFMDGADHGVILMSMGSVVPEESKPKEYFDTFVKVFSKLPQRILRKTKKEGIAELPNNVMTMKWLPQRDILAHPKCVLSITHGGMASLLEAVHTGVPTVTIPHLGDQYRNGGYYRAKEVGLVIDPGQLTEDTLTAAVKEVLRNSKYKENMVRLSRIFQDQPISPGQTVVYWTEYVLRHRGAPHLRPASIMLSWYQLALLDVLGVILAGIVIIIVISYGVVRIVCSKESRRCGKQRLTKFLLFPEKFFSFNSNGQSCVVNQTNKNKVERVTKRLIRFKQGTKKL